jgi:hypothetical protein
MDFFESILIGINSPAANLVQKKHNQAGGCPSALLVLSWATEGFLETAFRTFKSLACAGNDVNSFTSLTHRNDATGRSIHPAENQGLGSWVARNQL